MAFINLDLDYFFVVVGATAMSRKSGDFPMFLFLEKERIGYFMRIHRSATHRRRHGRAEGETIRYILP